MAEGGRDNPLSAFLSIPNLVGHKLEIFDSAWVKPMDITRPRMFSV
jgi:hypothetical protein